MNRSGSLIPLATALVALSAVAAPNVVFIAIDDLNDWNEAYGGHPDAVSPNIARLADMGMVFTSAYCNAPACRPSRTALMSGLRPSTSGIYFNNSDGENQLFSADYSATPEVFPVRSLSQFFSDNGWTTYGTGKIFHGTENPERWSVHQSVNAQAGSGVNSGPMDFGFFPDTRVDGIGTDDDRDYQAGNFGVSSITNHDTASSPFFVACGIYRPHLPFFVPQRIWNTWFDGDNQAQPWVALPSLLPNDIGDLGPMGRAMARNIAFDDPAGLTEPVSGQHDQIVAAGEWEESVAGYLASVQYADEQVGRLIDAVESVPGLATNTIFVLWSDHGWQLGEKESWRKFAMWENAARANLIIAAPGITPPGARCAAPVELLDIYPSLVGLCGLPEGAFLQGRNLRPLLENPDAAWNAHAITEQGIRFYAVRTGRYRYIHYDTGEEELYDYAADSSLPPGGLDGLGDWDNLVDKDTGLAAPGYEAVLADMRTHADIFWAPKRVGGFDGNYPWAAWPERAYPAQRMEVAKTGARTWAFGFEPGEGMNYGRTGGHLGWRAAFDVHTTARAPGLVAGFNQSVAVPAAGFVAREIDAGASRAAWVRFDAHLCPTLPPATTNGCFPATFHRDGSGNLRFWNATSSAWQSVALSDGWHTLMFFFDYERKVANAWIDGALAAEALSFNDASLETFSEFRFGQGAAITTNGWSYIDKLEVHAVENAAVGTGFDIWVNGHYPGGVFSGASGLLEEYAVLEPLKAGQGAEFNYLLRDAAEVGVVAETTTNLLQTFAAGSGALQESSFAETGGATRVVLTADPAAQDQLFVRLAVAPLGSAPPPVPDTALFRCDFEGVPAGATRLDELNSLTSAGSWSDPGANAGITVSFHSNDAAPHPVYGSGTLVADAMVDATAATLDYRLQANLALPVSLADLPVVSFDFSQFRNGAQNNKNHFVTGYDSTGLEVFRVVLQNYNHLDDRATERQIPGAEYLSAAGTPVRPAVSAATTQLGDVPAAFLWGSGNAELLVPSRMVRFEVRCLANGWKLHWDDQGMTGNTVLFPYFHAQVPGVGIPADLAHVILSGQKDAGAWYDNLSVIPWARK